MLQASYIRTIETFRYVTNFRKFLEMSQVQMLCIQGLYSYNKISLLKFDNFMKLILGTLEDDHHVVKTVILTKQN